MNFAHPLSMTTSPYSVTLSRRAQTRRVKRSYALLLPDQVLSEVCGTARVPSAVRERLLVTFMTQQRELEQQLRELEQQQQQHQRELEQEMKQKQDKLEDKLEQQQDKLEREIRERSQWQLAAKDAQHLVQSRTTELLVLKGCMRCMNLRGVLEFVENEAKKFGAPNVSRFALWKWILQKEPDLKACIQTGTSWNEQTIPGKIQSLYDTLNKHHHVGKTPAEWTATGGLKLEEGAKVSILDCRLLKCICKSYGIQAELIPKSDQYSDSDQNTDSDID
ncbi:TPA: hypothetical protein ACH3X1_002372 [Trebouxia sp. C0004]